MSISASHGKNPMKFGEVYEMIMIKEIKRIKDGGTSSSGSELSVDRKGKNMNHGGGQRAKLMSKNGRSELKAPSNNSQNNKDVDC